MSYDKEKFLEEIANEPMTFMGGDIPSIDDIANRIHIAWYKGIELKLSEEVKAYTESLRTPADGDEPLPKSSVENEIEESWNLAEYIYGTSVAKELNKICPYDGALLCDLTFYSLLRKGLSKKDVYKEMLAYSEYDWSEKLKSWEETIEYSFKMLNNKTHKA